MGISARRFRAADDGRQLPIRSGGLSGKTGGFRFLLQKNRRRRACLCCACAVA
jgi:hypothetical protein